MFSNPSIYVKYTPESIKKMTEKVNGDGEVLNL